MPGTNHSASPTAPSCFSADVATEDSAATAESRLDRKRRADRVAQRNHRRRQKLYIEELEAEVALLKSASEAETAARHATQNLRLQKELKEMQALWDEMEGLFRRQHELRQHSILDELSNSGVCCSKAQAMSADSEGSSQEEPVSENSNTQGDLHHSHADVRADARAAAISPLLADELARQEIQDEVQGLLDAEFGYLTEPAGVIQHEQNSVELTADGLDLDDRLINLALYDAPTILGASVGSAAMSKTPLTEGPSNTLQLSRVPPFWSQPPLPRTSPAASSHGVFLLDQPHAEGAVQHGHKPGSGEIALPDVEHLLGSSRNSHRHDSLSTSHQPFRLLRSMNNFDELSVGASIKHELSFGIPTPSPVVNMPACGSSGGLPLWQRPSMPGDVKVRMLIARAKQNKDSIGQPKIEDFLFENPRNTLSADLKMFLSPVCRLRRMPEYLATYWVLYLFFRYQVMQTPETYESIPPWFRPTTMQIMVPHPVGADLVAWPEIRDGMIRMTGSTQSHAANLDVVSMDIARYMTVDIQATESDLWGRSQQSITTEILDLANWKLGNEFFEIYPQLKGPTPMNTLAP
ncbi:hypothetical protein NCS56_00655600 [Fusarium sp. Ph1]|nr:hypothetical protein NCS56_00655600 [Fusarium sp. Ph1]